MAEELSPESKLYVKEEIEKVKNKFNEELEKVKSKTTKIFTTVVIIVGLLTGVGVYGSAKATIGSAINTTIDAKIKEVLGNETIDEKIKAAIGKENIEEKIKDEMNIVVSEDTVKEIENLKKKLQKDAMLVEEDANNAKDSFERVKDLHDKIVVYENDANEILSELNSRQLAKLNGYAWVGHIKLVWGMRESTKNEAEKFSFAPPGVDPKEYNFNECFTVIPNFGVVTETNAEYFCLDRHDDYGRWRTRPNLTFIAIGH